MKNTISIESRCFPVVIRSETAEGIPHKDFIVLTKEQLRAAQIVGESSKELIHRIYNRKGFEVLEIGTPKKRTLQVELSELWEGAF